MEESATPQCKMRPLFRKNIRVVEKNVQCADAFRAPGFSKGFEREVPFARVNFVGNKSLPFILVARTRCVKSSPVANFYCNLQGNAATSIKAHLDKAPTVVLGDENRGPCFRVVDQRRPPEFANVRQLGEDVHAISGAW